MSNKPKSVRKKKVIVTGFGAFLVVVLLFTVFFYFNFHTVEVKGESMEPTFSSGQRLLVSKAYWLVGPIKKNDIVVVDSKEHEYVIKRVYAMEGEAVDLYNVPDTWSLTNLAEGEYRVPPNKLYILGDNRPVSEDSRVYGPIDAKQVLGKVIVVGFGIPAKVDAKTK